MDKSCRVLRHHLSPCSRPMFPTSVVTGHWSVVTVGGAMMRVSKLSWLMKDEG